MRSSHQKVADRAQGLDPEIRAFREARAKARLRPYEVLFEDDRWSEAARVHADRLVQGGWLTSSNRVVPLDAPVEWETVVADDRSLQFHLHSWAPLAPALSGFDNTREGKYVRSALALALDWVQRYPSTDAPSPFAWYDMAVGIRAWRLGYLLDVAARSTSVSDAVVRELVRSVLLHQEVLADELRFPAHSNHGLYFAAGEAALALRFPELPGMEASRDRARRRLERLVHEQFTAEGVHREHSPGYQWMVLGTLEGLLSAGLLEAGDHRATLDRIQETMAWFVLPDGHLAMFGDTDRLRLSDVDWPHARSDALRFVLTEGREGQPPAEITRGFPASGYVVFRSEWLQAIDDAPGGSYLAQTCAFHSRTHKHADDLSFIWYDRGHEILIDAGRYGYLGRTEPGSDQWKDGFWYADPNRIHVESTRAHNTVEIDGRNLPRRGAEPYGSALMRWGDSAGIFYSEAGVRHWGSVCHRRLLLLRPTEWLLVFDWLLDEESDEHHFAQRFQFAPELEVEGAGNGGLVVTIPGEAEPLHVVSLVPVDLIPPVRGSREADRLEGWISRQDGEMLPAWASGFQAEGRPGQVFTTLFAFGDDLPRPLSDPRQAGSEENRFRLRWTHEGRIHTIAFRRPTRGPLDLRYRVGIPDGSGGGS